MLDLCSSMAVFVQAVDKGSFTAAADACGLSATMVGKHVRALEARVGARLLNRTTRQQSLTEVGRIYYQHCRQLLADIAVADALRAAPRGLLKIHAPVTFGSLRLAPALAVYLRRHPEVEVDLTLSDRTVDLVEEGYEATLRIGELAGSSLVARPLQPYRMWLCAAPAYLAERGAPSEPAQLAGHDCLGFAYWRHKNSWRFGAGENVAVRGRFTANNGQALPSRPMHLLYPADRRPTPKLASFIGFMLAAFA